MNFAKKQRVVGIVVLIAFIALLIPFLFTSGIKRKHSAGDEIPINAKKRQLIAQQIQSINDTDGASVPVPKPVDGEHALVLPQDQFEQPEGILTADDQVATTKTMDSQSQQQALPKPETFPIVVSETVFEESAENIPKDIKLVAATATVNTAGKNQKVKKTQTAKEVSRKNTGVKPAKATIGKKDSQEFWSVQVGSFSNQERVQKLITELHAKGYHVYMQKVTTSNQEVLTRILVGRETSKEKANKIAQQIVTTMKIKGYVVRNNQ